MIKPICDFCKEELEEPGGIILSPPVETKIIQGRTLTTGIVIELHICKKCYDEEIVDGLLARYRGRKNGN